MSFPYYGDPHTDAVIRDLKAKPWLITVRNRRSKAWYALHEQLARETYGPRLPYWLKDFWS